jgi:hypothetical protein
VLSDGHLLSGNGLLKVFFFFLHMNDYFKGFRVLGLFCFGKFDILIAWGML